jgi:hypothetical protein
MRDLTQKRIALNQVAFRSANERIEAAIGDLDVQGFVPFICECADPTCVALIRMSLAEYERMRENPRRFFNAPGHEQISVDAGAGVVVEHADGYVLVDKIGVAGEVASHAFGRKAISDV